MISTSAIIALSVLCAVCCLILSMGNSLNLRRFLKESNHGACMPRRESEMFQKATDSRMEKIEGHLEHATQNLELSIANLDRTSEERARRIHERIDALSNELPSRIITILKNTGAIK